MKPLKLLRFSDVFLRYGTSYRVSRTMHTPTEMNQVQRVLDVMKNLPPHTAAYGETEDSYPQNNQSEKTDRSYLKLCSDFEESLLNKPMLTRGDESTSNTIAVVKVMHSNLGLDLNGMMNLLRRCPDIYSMDCKTVESRIEFLRKMKVQGTWLQKTISRTPQILLMTESEIDITTKFLINNLDFTVAELPELFFNSPNVLVDPPNVTEEKYQYMFFTMGEKSQQGYAKYGVLQFSLNHIRARHIFLDRRGQFQLATKTGSTTIENPKIQRIVCNSDAYFCKEVALCALGEFQLFKRVLAHEDKIRMSDNNEDESESESGMQLADKLLNEMSKAS